MEPKTSIIFPFNELIDTRLILSFGGFVNIDDLQTYLTEPLIAEQIIDGIQSNLSANVYGSIEISDLWAGGLGETIIRFIFDRLFI